MRITGWSAFVATCLAAALAATGCAAVEEWDVGVSVGELSPAPFGTRVDHSHVWTGAELFVWGGSGGERGGLHADGAAYAPDTDAWRVVADADLSPRTRHTTVALGDGRVLVWGGSTATHSGDEDGLMARDGAIYHPGSDSWEPIADAPEARSLAPAAVAGDHVVFGGGGYRGDLLVYSLADDAWDSVAVAGAGELFRVFDLAAVDDEVVLAGATFERMFTGRFRIGDPSAPLVEFADVEDVRGMYLGLAARPEGGALLAVEEGREGRLYEVDGRGRAAPVHEAEHFQPPVHTGAFPLLAGEMEFVDGLGAVATNAGGFSLWNMDTGLAHRSGSGTLDGYCGPIEPVGPDVLIGWGGRCETGRIRVDLRA